MDQTTNTVPIIIKTYTLKFKIMSTNITNISKMNNLPNSYDELLYVLKNINSSINYSSNNITFCIDGKPFSKNSNTIIYPTTKNNNYFIVVLVQPIQIKQMHNDWGPDVRSTVEGYVVPGSKTKFVPKNRLGEDVGVSLTIPEGTPLRDKNGNPIKISVKTVKGPSKINGFYNVSKD